MKAFYIDALRQQITEVSLSKSINKRLVQVRAHVCGDIAVAHELKNGDTFLCDDEGLFKNYLHGFSVKGAHQEFFLGNGAVLGFTDTGDIREVQTPVEKIKELVKFVILLPRRELRNEQ